MSDNESSTPVIHSFAVAVPSRHQCLFWGGGALNAVVPLGRRGAWLKTFGKDCGEIAKRLQLNDVLPGVGNDADPSVPMRIANRILDGADPLDGYRSRTSCSCTLPSSVRG